MQIALHDAYDGIRISSGADSDGHPPRSSTGGLHTVDTRCLQKSGSPDAQCLSWHASLFPLKESPQKLLAVGTFRDGQTKRTK